MLNKKLNRYFFGPLSGRGLQPYFKVSDLEKGIRLLEKKHGKKHKEVIEVIKDLRDLLGL